MSEPGWTKPWSGKCVAFSWGVIGSDDSGYKRNADLLLVDHDTTDDFMLIADCSGEDPGNVDIEFTFDEGERLAHWILEAIALRKSPEGQALQRRLIRQAAKHARANHDF